MEPGLRHADKEWKKEGGPGMGAKEEPKA